MRTRFLRGTTADNNGLTLPSGELSIDSEKQAVRLHDGTTLGGFEIIGTRAYVPPMGPGPTELIAGTMTAGFFGEVTSADLLTYEALATQIGLSAGVSQYNAESLWLKFALEGEILFVAKKPARHSINWNSINAVNAVFEGGSQITIGSHVLGVTLLRGAAADPTTSDTGYDITASHGSEWNRLFYPIHSGTHTETLNPATHTDPNAAPFGAWAAYSDADLLIHNNFGDGSYNWCQEVHGSALDRRIYRGYYGVSYLGRSPATTANLNLGWRPCLRLKP